MLSAWQLYELGGNVDAVRGVMDRLSAAGADIVLIPAVAIELMLLARMSKG